jgi:hypothetical protein
MSSFTGKYTYDSKRFPADSHRNGFVLYVSVGQGADEGPPGRAADKYDCHCEEDSPAGAGEDDAAICSLALRSVCGYWFRVITGGNAAQLASLHHG